MNGEYSHAGSSGCHNLPRKMDAAAGDQRLRDLQRDYLDFLDDEVTCVADSTILFYCTTQNSHRNTYVKFEIIVKKFKVIAWYFSL